MTTPRSILIVGASAAGLSTAEALRRLGYGGRLTLLDAEARLPYDRPPLSKQVLAGEWEPSRAQLRDVAKLEALDAELILGEPAAAFDAEARAVTDGSGRAHRADAVVIATGLATAALPGQDGLSGVHVLRGMDDAVALRAHLAEGPRLVVVGEGVLGAEVAATARGLGLDVTLAGMGHTLLGEQVGAEVGGMLTRLHAERGVRLRLGAEVTGFASDKPATSGPVNDKLATGGPVRGRPADGGPTTSGPMDGGPTTGGPVDGGRVSGVRLTTGELLPAEAVVVAVGCRPATGWLEGSGLVLGDGVACDARCRAADGVYAVGDVASFWHEGLHRRLRLENRTNATEQAQVVAANLLGADRPYVPIPYFWTDQYDVKIQTHGLPSPEAELSVAEGDPSERRFAALYREGGRVTGVLGWNMAKQARLLRQRALA